LPAHPSAGAAAESSGRVMSWPAFTQYIGFKKNIDNMFFRTYEAGVPQRESSMPETLYTATAEPVVVDLRPMIPPERHATVFAALEALGPGATFVLINDHAPIPLLRRIEENWPDRFEATYLRDGPEVWQVAITRNQAE
jgi:uncharacterized protein (DUF2249 family)